MRFPAFCVCAVLLSACATSPLKSESGELPANEVAYLSGLMKESFVSGLDYDRPVHLVAPNHQTALSKALHDKLYDQGYQLVDRAGPNVQQVRYEVGPYGRDVLVRMMIDEQEVSTIVRRRPDGRLEFGYPFTVLSVEP